MNSLAWNGKKNSPSNKSNDLLDPNLLKSARKIYYTYCHFHTKLKRSPVGVAISKKTHKGQLLFTANPILLPDEHFICITQIESADYTN
jgi:hypothetical protein